MLIVRNIVIEGKHQKPILLDFGYQPNGMPHPIVVFAHGFKGFKDWGHFNKVMEYFIENGFAFVKFNFSHNGGTVEQPIDFPDLEAFGNNNYTKELDDLSTVIDWIENNNLIADKEINKQQIYLIGHSRGGGISILAAHEDNRIKKVVTWAAVADLINRYSEEQISYWKKAGVIYVENSRTNQQMPLYYQLAENTLNNKVRFNVELAAKNLTIPHLIIHGTKDEAVPVNEASKINQWNSTSQLFIIEGAGHAFGASHPFSSTTFPPYAQIVLDKTLDFLKNKSSLY
ncbi:MAG: alpha/beta hydrolase [Flavobacteriales bacterium CG_4_10_14_0_2_um_filter_32_8]|nr:MAG: alpha/beta hydrolase [Flavobacteriales bacterium CG_4_10_14_0_2_um_filter_32_8]PJB15762.1 MAG: alpha/beta hydrolase [Flavobacteriales bacterium CG_4_9_14_3_um_filter_32_8]